VTEAAHSSPHDLIVVLRLWTEAHDPRPRARLLVGAVEPGEPLIGTTAIVEAVESVVRSFEKEGEPGPDRPMRRW
jgi:hypothetical protein